MVLGTKSSLWHVSVYVVTMTDGLGTDIRYEKDGDQPVKK